MWRFLLNDAYGMINYVIFGVETNLYIPWLAYPGTALGAIIVADIWKTSSFAALLILAGLQVIPREVYQAGLVDGAAGWRRFRHITWPLIRPAGHGGPAVSNIDAFRVFDLAYVLTREGRRMPRMCCNCTGIKRCLSKGGWGMDPPYPYAFSS